MPVISGLAQRATALLARSCLRSRWSAQSSKGVRAASDCSVMVCASVSTTACWPARSTVLLPPTLSSALPAGTRDDALALRVCIQPVAAAALHREPCALRSDARAFTLQQLAHAQYGHAAGEFERDLLIIQQTD